VTENLSAKIDNYAIYLPALSREYCEYIIKPSDSSAPGKVKPIHLNFLTKSNPLWHYKWCLASAGHLAYSNSSNAITRRNPKTSIVVGDSGGYQVGSGALKETKTWAGYAKRTGEIVRLWNASAVKDEILNWLDAHCDYAMTLDMPLWARSEQFKTSPFHHCSVEELTEMTVENLKFIEKRRGRGGQCKFLNVLQGNDEEEEEHWYRKIHAFDFEGWAFGTKISWASGVRRLLRRILLMRDEGMLGGRKEWLHLLGVSQLIWAVALTAIQRGIQKNVGTTFTVSFDSSTPFLIAGKYQKYALPPTLTPDMASWTFQSRPFPVGYFAATGEANNPFPSGSPIARLLTVGDMNPKKSPYDAYTFGKFSSFILGNHNAYVYLRAFVEANEAAYKARIAPQAVADVVGIIAQLFEAEEWEGLLTDKKLDAVLGPKQAPDSDEVSSY
jgi:hypothetical protein